MKICHVASEVSPIAKAGGLADVTIGLSRATKKAGHDVCIIMPKYSCLKTELIKNLSLHKKDVLCSFGGKWYSNDIWLGMVYDIKVFFLEVTSPHRFFDREQIYGYRDDLVRFSYFSAAVLNFIFADLPKVQIIHIHEWHASLLAPIYKEHYKAKLSASIVLTIHNLNYQGIGSPSILNKANLDPRKYFTPETLQDTRKKDKVNLLKGGIIYSDYITTVSPQYAKEIQSPKSSNGLYEVITKNRSKITGILNGVDCNIWNPISDDALVINYDYATLGKKKVIKNHLRKFFHMPQDNVPLITCISRLVPQKGIKMIKKAIFSSLELGGQFILFGSSPIPKIQDDFERLKEQLENNKNVLFIFNSYNEDLAHQIYAAADILIVPSIFEPCGLTQLIALQYGTVPVVRKTGGLANTVFDIEHDKDYPLKTNGFTFQKPTETGIHQALKRAFKVFTESPHTWKEIIRRGMSMDFSWKDPADQYLAIYQKIQTISNGDTTESTS